MTSKDHILGASQSFPKTIAALAYAERLHAGQRRQADGAPFILHPLEVCCLLYHTGAPDHVIAAGVLHDTIEKTNANAADLRTRFGLTIATLVLAVSEDQRILGYAQRKAALRAQVAGAGRETLMVFAADKISKARELSLEREQTRPSRLQPAVVSVERDRKLAHYRRCLDLVEQLLTDSPLVTQLRTELENPPGISKRPGRTSRRRTSLAQGEIRWDLVTETLGCSSKTTASRAWRQVTRRTSQSQVGRDG